MDRDCHSLVAVAVGLVVQMVLENRIVEHLAVVADVAGFAARKAAVVDSLERKGVLEEGRSAVAVAVDHHRMVPVAEAGTFDATIALAGLEIVVDIAVETLKTPGALHSLAAP